jgi:hypothetical protein
MKIGKKEFDDAFLIKSRKQKEFYKKCIVINTLLCTIALLLIKIFKLDILLNYPFVSFFIIHVYVMKIGFNYWHDFARNRTGETKYLEKYYPEIWKKINPYGNIIIRKEFLKYNHGKYLINKGDEIIDYLKKVKMR